MMLFETARLAGENGDDPAAATRRRHRQEIPANSD
jgi:hypothetical protein